MSLPAPPSRPHPAFQTTPCVGARIAGGWGGGVPRSLNNGQQLPPTNAAGSPRTPDQGWGPLRPGLVTHGLL